MRSRHARWLVLSILLVGSIGCSNLSQQAKPAVDPAAIGASIDSLNQSFTAAVAARDTDAVAGLYASDAHLLPANMARADGHDAIRAMWGQFLRTPGLELTTSGSELMISEAGDMVVDMGHYNLKMADAKGKPMEDVGKYVMILKKVDGAWKIAVDTFNSDKAVPGM